MKHFQIIGWVIGICLAASLARLAGINQEVVDTGAMMSALAMSIVLMVRVGRNVR